MPAQLHHLCETCGQWILPTDVESHLDSNQTHVITEKLRYVPSGEETSPVDENTTAPPNAKYGAIASLNGLVHSATGVSTTSSSSWQLVGSMTTTPDEGTYYVSFSSSGYCSSKNKTQYIGIFEGTTLVADSERISNVRSGNVNTDTYRHLYTQAVVTVNGSQAISVGCKTSGGTFYIGTRNLILVRIGP